MREYHQIKEMLCKELKEFARKDELSAGSLDVIYKLTSSIKNIDKMEMFEGGGYSRRGSSYDSYDGGSSRRSYSREEDNYDGGDSYRRGYSRNGSDFKTKIREMMEDARNEEEKEIYRRIMREME